MGLSNDLITQFVKVTNDKKKEKKETVVYGTAKTVDGVKYVQLDGSELLTPVSSTTNIADGNRVTVMIKNHTATVTGNITSPSPSGSDLDNVLYQILEFEQLTTNTFSSHAADIENLKTTKLDVESADLKYANINFTNITEASVENLFTKSGMIKDLVMSSGSVTGELVGVRIKGDLIEAQSITANKINVDDLKAFNATIGGFKITDNSIYSGVKSSINNTTRGIYLDTDGQIVFGDTSNFVKLYKDISDSEERYKLDMSVNDLLIAGTIQMYRNDYKALYGIAHNGSPCIERYRPNENEYNTRFEINENDMHFSAADGPGFKAIIKDGSGNGGIKIGQSTAYLKWLQNSEEIQVRNNADNAYSKITASAFVNGSKKEFKENIEDINDDVVNNIVMDNYIKKYNLISEREEIERIEQEAEDKGIILDPDQLRINEKAGLILEDLTDEAKQMLNPERTEGVDLYTMVSLLWRHNQIQQNKIDRLEAKLDMLSYQINNL